MASLRRLKFILVVVLGLAFADRAYGSANEICRRVSGNLQALTDMSHSTQCLAQRQTPECREIYQELENSGERLEDFAPSCESKEKSLQDHLTQNKIWRCGVGAFEASFGELGRMIGNSAGWIATEIEFRKECNNSLEHKKRLFLVYNESVDARLRMVPPSEAKLVAHDCVDLRKSIFEHHRRQQIRVNGGVVRDLDIDLIEAAKAGLKDIGVKLECYNSKRAAQLVCAGLSVVGAPGGLAALSKISKLAGVKKLKGIGAASLETKSWVRPQTEVIKLIIRNQRVRSLDEIINPAAPLLDKMGVRKIGVVRQKNGQWEGSYELPKDADEFNGAFDRFNEVRPPEEHIRTRLYKADGQVDKETFVTRWAENGELPAFIQQGDDLSLHDGIEHATAQMVFPARFQEQSTGNMKMIVDLLNKPEFKTPDFANQRDKIFDELADRIENVRSPRGTRTQSYYEVFKSWQGAIPDASFMHRNLSNLVLNKRQRELRNQVMREIEKSNTPGIPEIETYRPFLERRLRGE